MNKVIRILVAVIALAVTAFLVSLGPAPHWKAYNIDEDKFITPIVTPVPIPDDEAIHVITTIAAAEAEAEDDFWDSDLHWLAMALEKESGVDWEPWQVVMIGDVIMHRVRSDLFPNTIKEVLLDPGQYEPFFGDFEPFMPEQYYIDIADAILNDGESYLSDERIVYQALFPQGEKTVFSIYDEALGTTTYFCR